MSRETRCHSDTSRAAGAFSPGWPQSGAPSRGPKEREDVTGIPYEPWHYRYVGAETAQTIRENGWTLEEYCERSVG